MIYRELKYGTEARSLLRKGVDTITDAVKVTMGPKGRNVIIDKGIGSGTVTKDGVTVANSIDVRGKYENLGVNLTKEASRRTNEKAGDGTTLTCVLTQALYAGADKHITAGADPMALKRGMDKAADVYNGRLDSLAKPCSDIKTLNRVASISANDPVLGKKVAELMKKVGKEGAATIEESDTNEDSYEFVSGMQFEQGYVSPYFINDGYRQRCLMDDAYIFLTDRVIRDNDDIVPLLELVNSSTKRIVIIAEDITGPALNTVIANRIKGVMATLAVKAPSFGERRKQMLEDIAAVTGATVLSEEKGYKISEVEKEHLGRAKRVEASSNKTVIVGGSGTKRAVSRRISFVRANLDTADNDYDKERLRERIAKLKGGIGVFKVGASSNTELMEKKQRVEDAIYATKGAMLEGIVAGGGYTLAKLSEGTNLKNHTKDLKHDELLGFLTVKNALKYPLKQIATNAGETGEYVLSECTRLGKGFNAATGEYVDLFKDGVIDPKMVLRYAVAHAVSAAGMLITSECAIVKEDEDEDEE